MRSQAIEKLATMICEAIDGLPDCDDDTFLQKMDRLKNLRVKMSILTDRYSNSDASVIREIMNGRV